ncbi:MAG: YCF48-related protein [Bacteroidota bacterium]
MSILRAIFFGWFLILNLQVFGQWIQINSPTTYQLHSIFFYDQNLGYFGGAGGIYKTSDGGNNISKIYYTTPDSTYLEIINEHHLWFTSPTTGFAAGWHFVNDNEVIIQTTDSGITWAQVKSGPAGTLFKDIFFTSSFTGYVVGWKGRILKTTDGGSTWTLKSSGTTYDLNAVFFTSADTGYAGGDVGVLKTTNAGQTWTSVSSQFTDNSFFFKNNDIGYATSYNGKVYKTINGGTTWTLTQTGSNCTFNKIVFVNDSTGYIAAANSSGGKIFKTSSYGKYWEPQPSSEDTSGFISIAFPSVNKGFAVGENGVLYQTLNDGGPVAPSPFFTQPTIFCEDSSYTFYNQGPPGYTYNWYKNGVKIASTYNLTTAFGADSTYKIKLEASNGLYTDTISVQFKTQKSLKFNVQVNHNYDTLHCPSAESPNLYVPASISGVSYTVKKGATVIGTTKTGNGTQLSFPLSGITIGQNIFTLFATNTNSCGTKVITLSDTVYYFPTSYGATFEVSDTAVCKGKDSVFVIVKNTMKKITYKIGTLSMVGNGATIIFPLGPLWSTTNINVQTIIYGLSSCSGYLENGKTIMVKVRDLKVDFTANSGFKGQLIPLTNLSDGDAYQWNFGAGSNPLTDTAKIPTLIYTTTGEKSIFLKSTTIEGCMDSIEHNITIYNPAPGGAGAYCYASHFIGSKDHKPLAYHVDVFGNNYITGYYSTGTYGTCLFYSTQYQLFFMKTDKYGTVLWEKTYPTTNCLKNSFGTGITSDSLGNTYLCGNFSGNSLNFDNVALIPVDKNLSNSFVVKFNPTGIAQWGIMGTGQSGDNHFATDITMSDNQNIYIVDVTENGTADFKMPDNSVINCTGGNITILHTDENGNFIDYIFGNTVNSFMFLNPDISAYTSPRAAGIAPQIKIAQDKKIILIGSMTGYYSFGTYAKTGSTSTPYVAVYNGTSWMNAFDVAALTATIGGKTKECDIDNDGNIYITGGWDFANSSYTSVIGGDIIQGPCKKNFIAKYGQNGNLIWYNILESLNTVNPNLTGTFYPTNVKTHSNGNVYVYGNFQKLAGFGNLQQEPAAILTSKGLDYFIAEYDPNGVLLSVNTYGGNTDDNTVLMSKDKCGDFYTLIKSKDIVLAGDTTQSATSLFVAGKYSPDGNCIKKLNCTPITNDTLTITSVDKICKPNRVELFWFSTNINAVDVSLSLDTGKTFTLITSGVNASDEKYYWNIPDSIADGSLVQFKISDTAASGQFVISTSIQIAKTPKIKLGNDTTVCQGSTFTLSPVVSSGISSYLWTPDNYTTKDITVTANSSKTYVLKATTMYGCSSSDTMYLGIILKPGVSVSNGPLFYSCPSTPRTLTAQVTGNPPGMTYSWSPSGQTSQSIVFQSTQVGNHTYTLTAVSGQGCFNTTTANVIVQGVKAQADDTICKGSSVLIKANFYGPPSSTTFYWGSCCTITNPQILVTPDSSKAKVSYIANINITSYNGACAMTASDTVDIYFYPKMNNPVITESFDSLISTTAVTYQWYYSTALLSGETQQSFHPQSNGPYKVIVTDSNGCSYSSAVYTFIKVNIESYDKNELSFIASPNPYTNRTIVSYFLPEQNHVIMSVYNNLGQQVAVVINADQPPGEHKYSFSAEDYGYGEGVYFIKLQVNEQVSVIPLVELH